MPGLPQVHHNHLHDLLDVPFEKVHVVQLRLVLTILIIFVSRTSTAKGFDIQISERDLGGGDVGPSGHLL